MGLIGGYLGYMFVHERRAPRQGGLEVRGTVHWTLNPERVQTAGWDSLLRDWNDAGYKIGLLIRQEQTIRELVYGGVRLKLITPQGPEVTNLDQTYGTPVGFKWAAWGGRGPRLHEFISPIIVTFPVRMRIAPGGLGPQMIPVASRHRKGSFAQSMPGVWAIGGPKSAPVARRSRAGRRRRALRGARRARA